MVQKDGTNLSLNKTDDHKTSLYTGLCLISVTIGDLMCFPFHRQISIFDLFTACLN